MQGRWAQEVELSAMKKESEVWALLRMLSEERMDRRRGEGRKEKKERRSSAKNATLSRSTPFPGALAQLSHRVEDREYALDAINEDEVLKEVEIVVKWLERVVGPSNSPLGTDDRAHNNHHLQQQQERGVNGSIAGTASGVIGLAIPGAAKLDWNGRKFESASSASSQQASAKKPSHGKKTSLAPPTASLMDQDDAAEESSDESNSDDGRASHTSTPGPSGAKSSPDRLLSERIWYLFRGGEEEGVRVLLERSGQSGRWASIAPLLSHPALASFHDPAVFNDANNASTSTRSMDVDHSANGGMNGTAAPPSSFGLWKTPSAAGSSSSQKSVSSGLVHRQLLKDTCSSIALSSDPSIDEFERALTACVGGVLGRVFPVCSSWEDFLWAFLKTYFFQRIDAILAPSPSAEFPSGLLWSQPCPSASAGVDTFHDNARRVGDNSASLLTASIVSHMDSLNTMASISLETNGIHAKKEGEEEGGGGDKKRPFLFSRNNGPKASDRSSTATSSIFEEERKSTVSSSEGGHRMAQRPLEESFDTLLSSLTSHPSSSSEDSSFASRAQHQHFQQHQHQKTSPASFRQAMIDFFTSLADSKLPSALMPLAPSSERSSSTGLVSEGIVPKGIMSRVAKEASQPFRRVPSLLILQEWPSLLRSLRKLVCSSESLVDTGDDELRDPLASTNGTNSSSAGEPPHHLLRFAAHLVLVLGAVYPSIYDEQDAEVNVMASNNQKKFSTQNRVFSSLVDSTSSSTTSSASSMANDATLILSRYITYLMDEKEGCQHLVAQYCARMPSQRSQVGYELYVKMMRRIRDRREREEALTLASDAGLDANLIASLLVEDIINHPQDESEDSGLMKTGHGVIRPTSGSSVLSSLPSRIHPANSSPSPLLSTRLERTTNPKVKIEIGSAIGAPKSSLFSAPSNAPLSLPSTLLFLSKNAKGKQSLPMSSAQLISQLVSVAAMGSKPSDLLASSRPNAGQAMHSSSSVPAVDAERIHALEWLTLSESDEASKVLCLKHAVALARTFILSSHFASAHLLFASVNRILSGLFSSHSLDEDDDAWDAAAVATAEEQDEDVSSLSQASSNVHSSSPKALLREYMSLSSWLDAINAFATWFEAGGAKQSALWSARGFATSTGPSRPSPADLDPLPFPSDDTKEKSLSTTNEASSTEASGVPMPSLDDSSNSARLQQLSAEALAKLGHIIYYPYGWLVQTGASSSTAASSQENNPFQSPLMDSSLPSSRSAQLNLLLEIGLPSAMLLLQHILLCSGRASDAVSMANDLADSKRGLIPHFAPHTIHAFLLQVHLASLQHLSSTPTSTNDATHSTFPF